MDNDLLVANEAASKQSLNKCGKLLGWKTVCANCQTSLCVPKCSKCGSTRNQLEAVEQAGTSTRTRSSTNLFNKFVLRLSKYQRIEQISETMKLGSDEIRSNFNLQFDHHTFCNHGSYGHGIF